MESGADELAVHRRRKSEALRPVAMRVFLQDLYDGYVDGSLDPMPAAVVVILLGEQGPSVHWAGAPTTPKLQQAAGALHQAIMKRLLWPTPEGIAAYQRRQEEFALSHPWECSIADCHRRFKTERGRNIHERTHKQ